MEKCKTKSEIDESNKEKGESEGNDKVRRIKDKK